MGRLHRGPSQLHCQVLSSEVFLHITTTLLSVGIMVGTLMTLFVYDIYNERLVFAVALGFPGFLNLLTPFFATQGGYYVTTILR